MNMAKTHAYGEAKTTFQVPYPKICRALQPT